MPVSPLETFNKVVLNSEYAAPLERVAAFGKEEHPDAQTPPPEFLTFSHVPTPCSAISDSHRLVPSSRASKTLDFEAL